MPFPWNNRCHAGILQCPLAPIPTPLGVLPQGLADPHTAQIVSRHSDGPLSWIAHAGPTAVMYDAREATGCVTPAEGNELACPRDLNTPPNTAAKAAQATIPTPKKHQRPRQHGMRGHFGRTLCTKTLAASMLCVLLIQGNVSQTTCALTTTLNIIPQATTHTQGQAEHAADHNPSTTMQKVFQATCNTC